MATGLVIDTRGSFDTWRNAARSLLRESHRPEDVIFFDSSLGEAPLPGMQLEIGSAHEQTNDLKIDKRFFSLARNVSCHRDESKWSLMYQLAWRIVCDNEKTLLSDSADRDVRKAEAMQKQVRFDAHKFKAFVRFKKVVDMPAADDDAVHATDAVHYVAWHRPEHRTLPLVAPFFAKRFAVMRWTIFTPFDSAHWDGQSLRMGAGVPASEVAHEDKIEELWIAYYGAIFNPARVKIGAMLREMPRRYWATMPESTIIDDLLRDAPARVLTMLGRAKSNEPKTAEPYLPPEGHRSLPQLANAIRECRGCDLYQHAHQPVFGEGSADANLMIIGEQPGDTEDCVGRPFVGPAGQLLDRVLANIPIHHDDLYLTNAVKHFRFTQIESASSETSQVDTNQRGRRLHKKATITQMRACRPWMLAEIDSVQPTVIAALGATAVRSLLGAHITIAKNRGECSSLPDRPNITVLPTYHPAAILRSRGKRAAAMQAALEDDLASAWQLSGSKRQ